MSSSQMLSRTRAQESPISVADVGAVGMPSVGREFSSYYFYYYFLFAYGHRQASCYASGDERA